MDWGNAIVVDPLAWRRLHDDNARLSASSRWWRLGAYGLTAMCAVASANAYWNDVHRATASSELQECRETVTRSTTGLAALAHSQRRMLAATEKAPSVGTKSWGRRFIVTKYLPRSPQYGRFNTGFTATLTKAEPKARIVAVDPALIPYGSWVWIEGLGWFQAEDCGAAIKGFRLDVLTATQDDALSFGKHDLFAIVVPADTSWKAASAR